MKLKALKCKLGYLSSFKSPKLKYEQYSTPTDIAALVAHIIETQYADIKDKSILDLCCGTGILGIAASFFEPYYILGVDIDESALEVAVENYMSYGLVNADLLQSDLRYLALDKFDTAIMNPPFGTREPHIDFKAVQVALECCEVVYSLHKSSTRDYLLKKFKGKVLGNIKFEIPSSYDFHQKQMCHIDVDLIRFINP